MDSAPIAMIEHITTAGCIDTAALALVILFCVAGSIRGLAGECGRFLALAAGIAVTLLLYPVFKTNVFSGHELPWKVLAMICAVLSAVVVGLLVNYLVKRFLRIIVGQPADSIIGAIISMLTTALAIVVVLFFLYDLPNSSLRSTVFDKSTTGRLSEPLIVFAKNKMSPQ